MASNNHRHHHHGRRSSHHVPPNYFPPSPLGPGPAPMSIPIPGPPQPLYPMPPYPTAPYVGYPYPTVPYPMSPYPLSPMPPQSPHHPRRPPPRVPTPLHTIVGPTLVDNFLERAHTRLEPPGGSGGGKNKAHVFWTEDDLNDELDAQLALVRRGVQDIASQELGLPGDVAPRVTVRLCPADLSAEGQWRAGQGELWRRGATVLMPKVIIRMPERRDLVGNNNNHRHNRRDRRGEGGGRGGPSLGDRAYMDAAKRVLDAVIHAQGLNRYDARTNLRGLPFDPKGDLAHACFEWRDTTSAGEDVCHFMPSHAHVYLPTKPKRVNHQNTWLYERLYGGHPGAMAHLTKWADRRGIDLSFLIPIRV
ncbi:uncharacterized protein F4812DRAFT_471237 [Daldinia caldariorum]|uniref:uncharacterized protein n=1 Tax=Daldinia caldariorum TaxID=326644 RepID=UPI002007AD8E|nr:uncharacterized protein F4812DRAFT_471237 [Daldinia caldariorum]KAI1467882.1 hypothetical protein F4812DRAFT_471237 [Daldinia caldariorum]